MRGRRRERTRARSDTERGKYLMRIKFAVNCLRLRINPLRVPLLGQRRVPPALRCGPVDDQTDNQNLPQGNNPRSAAFGEPVYVKCRYSRLCMQPVLVTA